MSGLRGLTATLVVLALLISGCSQEAVGNIGDLTIEGQIENWQTSFGTTLNAVGGSNEALGSGSVNRSGEFEVVVSPPFYTLGNIAPCQNDRSTVVSTPEALRVSSAKLEIAEQSSSFITRNEGRGVPKEVINVYADQAGTVQGQVECTGRYQVTYRFNLELVHGWNLVLVSTEIADETTREAIATYTSTTETAVTAFGWFAYVP